MNSYHIKLMNEAQIPPTDYIFRRLENRDTDSDNFLSIPDLSNYESMKIFLELRMKILRHTLLVNIVKQNLAN